MATTNKKSQAKKSTVNVDAAIVNAALEALAPKVNLEKARKLVNLEKAPKIAPVVKDVMTFAVQQLSAPVALTDAQKAEMKAELDAIKAKWGVKVAIVAKEPRGKRIEQNGIKRPLSTGGICDTMWRTMDEISNAKGSPATIAELKVALAQFNQVNLLGEYASWRKFNGIVGRLQKTTTPVNQITDDFGNIVSGK